MSTRLDLYVCEQYNLPSRERARSFIMQGRCFINGQRVDKAGHPVKEGDIVELKLPEEGFVSRGGHKLKKAIEEFTLILDGLHMMDIGASTGGFTDCALQNGAEYVYAIDVGYGQLDYRLRNDERVKCIERTNIRYLSEELVKHKINLFTIDVSFISLKLILPLLEKYSAESYNVIALIKPQFEAGRAEVGKNGVVKSDKIHISVIDSVLKYANDNNLYPFGLTYSPIKGPKGNIEFLIGLTNTKTDFVPDVTTTVAQAHQALIDT